MHVPQSRRRRWGLSRGVGEAYKEEIARYVCNLRDNCSVSFVGAQQLQAVGTRTPRIPGESSLVRPAP